MKRDKMVAGGLLDQILTTVSDATCAEVVAAFAANSIIVGPATADETAAQYIALQAQLAALPSSPEHDAAVMKLRAASLAAQATAVAVDALPAAKAS